MFRTVVTTFVAAFTMAVSLHAEEPAKTSYTATVTGVVCGSCRTHVETAVKKLPGAGDITFQKGFKDETQQVLFTATSATLVKEDVIKALGEDAESYKVLSLEKK